MDWLERHRGNIAAFLVVLVAVSAMVVLQLPRRPALQVTPPTAPPAPPSIKVHVTGAVLFPGVVQLPADARVDDALKAAGGLAGSAEAATLNLALPLRDGQQLVVPEKGVPTPAPLAVPQPAPSASINLNTATQKELETLPGIGPVTAQKIMEYRQTHGGFKAVEELKDAKIVNSSTYDKIKGLVEVR